MTEPVTQQNAVAVDPTGSLPSAGVMHASHALPPPGAPPGALLLVMFLAWYAQAAALILLALDSHRVPAGESGFIGSELVLSGVGGSATVLPALAGFVMLVLATLLVLGQGWALHPLAALSVVAIIGLAVHGSWIALVVIAMLVVAAVICCVPSVHDHLNAEKRIRGNDRENEQ